MLFLIGLSILLSAVGASIDEIDTLSPFAAHTYYLLESAGIFEELFAVNFTPEKAARVFLQSGLDFPGKLGLQDAGSLPEEVSAAGRRAFARPVTPIEHFQIYANSMEYYLRILGLITPGNYARYATLYFDTMVRDLNAMGPPANSAEKVHLMTVADADFVHLFGPVSEHNVKRMMRFFIGQLDMI